MNKINKIVTFLSYLSLFVILGVIIYGFTKKHDVGLLIFGGFFFVTGILAVQSIDAYGEQIKRTREVADKYRDL